MRSQFMTMKLTIEQEFEKENLKRYLEEHPEQAKMVVWQLFVRMIRGHQKHQKLESQYDDLLQRYITLHDAYLANLRLIRQKTVGQASNQIQLPNFSQEH